MSKPCAKTISRPFSLAVVCGLLTATAGFAFGGGVPRETWKTALTAVPQSWVVEDAAISNDYGRLEGVWPIWIEGERYRGKPTRIFAWWGLPKGASENARVPAMVLVHGGGGTAFARWVKIWTDRGYAAIAMDTCGKAPRGERDGKPHPTHDRSGPSGWGSSVGQVGEPLTDQWTFHAVSAIARCHSFLRARPEVDADRTGLTGISWGGYLTSIALCIDTRFRFAAPVYGCGHLDLNPAWDHKEMPSDYRTWLDRWDPKNFLPHAHENGGTHRLILWCDGTNDRWYTMEMLRRTCGHIDASVPLVLSLKLDMPHGHGPAGDPPEIAAFADFLLKGRPQPPRITSATLEAGNLAVAYETFGSSVVRSELLYTASTNTVHTKKDWCVQSGKQPNGDGSNICEANVPPNARLFFMNLISDRGHVISTRIFAQ